MKKLRAEDLISKYLKDDITPDERMLVENYFQKDLENSEYTPTEQDITEADERMKANLLKYIGTQKTKVVAIWPRAAAAASVLIFMAIGAYFLLRKPVVVSNPQVAQVIGVHDIAPGGNKAVLTLGNGKKVVLTGANNGLLAMQGNTIISKTADGQLVYDVKAADAGQEVTYNTMSTPRGGQYWVTLPDGSKVFLNAASSLKYPTAFTGTERKVELTGEAYFEVAHNKNMPFRVASNGQTVEVLGTHFNINAYNDEPETKTTLLEGSIRLSHNEQAILIKPGEQAVIANNVNSGAIKINDHADLDGIMAWKNGEFNFNETDIQSVMRQISRWYDVDIQYSGKIPTDRLQGTFSRNMTAAKALKLLEFTGINFKIEGRTIIVK